MVGGGVLDRRQAGGGATFKRKHINREFEFQSSSKMMSVSQKISFHHNKPVENSQKGKESCWCLCVGGFLSFQTCCCICCVLCERFVRCNPHLAWSSFVQSSPGRGSRGLLAMRHLWQRGPVAVATSLGMTPDPGAEALRTEHEQQSCIRHQGEPPGGVVRQCFRAPGSVSGRLAIARLNVPGDHAPLTTRQRNLNCLTASLSEPQSPGRLLQRIQSVACPCPLLCRPCFPGLLLLRGSLPRSYP